MYCCKRDQSWRHAIVEKMEILPNETTPCATWLPPPNTVHQHNSNSCCTAHGWQMVWQFCIGIGDTTVGIDCQLRFFRIGGPMFWCQWIGVLFLQISHSRSVVNFLPHFCLTFLWNTPLFAMNKVVNVFLGQVPCYTVVSTIEMYAMDTGGKVCTSHLSEDFSAMCGPFLRHCRQWPQDSKKCDRASEHSPRAANEWSCIRQETVPDGAGRG